MERRKNIQCHEESAFQKRLGNGLSVGLLERFLSFTMRQKSQRVGHTLK